MFKRCAITVAALCALSVSSCGDTTSITEALISALQKCGLVSEGAISVFGFDEDDFSKCVAECLVNDCDGLEELLCTEEGGDVLDACLLACDDKSEELTKVFRCDDGEEIPASYECDLAEDPDCEDGSDEHEGCEYFACDESSLHVGLHWVCDLIVDCEDGSDEDQDCAEPICPE